MFWCACLLQTPGSIVITADYVDFVEVRQQHPNSAWQQEQQCSNAS
jgi:hypothetical protein